ncbi:MAG TPA: GntR family transcriptional regulator [Jatrophihabitans sp.]
MSPTTGRPAPPTLMHSSLAKSAADWITERILNGDIEPGQKLAEVALADQMGVSRSPVREALRDLSREGLITIEPRRGAFVTELDGAEAADLYSCRLLLEPECVRLSVAAMTSERADRIGASFAHMRTAAESHDASAYVESLKDFNWDLLDGCPNRVLFGFAERSWKASLRYWDLTVRGSEGYVARSLRRNRAVQSAIVKRDPDRAADAAATVLRAGRDELVRLLSRLPARV